jgi:lysozyme
VTTPIKRPPTAKSSISKKRTNAITNSKPRLVRKVTKKKSGTKTGSYFRLTIVLLALILLSPFYYRYVTEGFLNGWHWLNDIGEDVNYRHYKSFNINVSERYTIHGIDVSYAQGKIDWTQVKAMDENGLHLSFVFIKATEGEQFVDSYFQRNWREAAKTGLICGAYHFFRPEKSGKKQAQLLLKTVKLERNDMPLVVDIEKLDGVDPLTMRNTLTEFFKTIQHRTRVKPIIYSGLSFYEDYLKGYFDGYPLWIAHYDKPDRQINRAAEWLFWQHSSKATVNGIHHAVDFDSFKGDTLAFKRLLLK